jgi:molybdate transport system substrate-binding protein
MKLMPWIAPVLLTAAAARGETITVSAALSTKETLQAIAADYEKATAVHVRFNFQGSGELEAQIEQGAPVDAFVSADDAEMDKLTAAGDTDPATRRVVARNRLVLIVPADSAAPASFPASFEGLKAVTGKIAIGNPKSVPAGRYAEQVFKTLKLDSAVAGRLVYGQNVRQVLTYVERGDVAAGVVYQTDADVAGDKVKVVATADAAAHDPIEYPAVVVKGSAHAAAAGRFLDYLKTDAAMAVWRAKGFLPAVKEKPGTQPGVAATVGEPGSAGHLP